MPRALVSVVIPTWNEESQIEACIDSVRTLEGTEGPLEIVVADGGSSDRTRELAARRARCLLAPKGRGTQMNEGARATRGEILLFLHADCRLEPGAIAQAREMMENPKVKAGCFRQRVEAPGVLFRGVEFASSWRARTLGIVYGDCGFFLRRELFDSLGGFPNVPLFEDFGISQKLKKIPGRIALASARIRVSPRRWKKLGFWRTTRMNWSLAVSYMRGASPQTLARRYESVQR